MLVYEQWQQVAEQSKFILYTILLHNYNSYYTMKYIIHIQKQYYKV